MSGRLRLGRFRPRVAVPEFAAPWWAWLVLGLLTFLMLLPILLMLYGKWWGWWMNEPFLPRVG